MLITLLTCKSLVELGCSGLRHGSENAGCRVSETVLFRPISPSSSWFRTIDAVELS